MTNTTRFQINVGDIQDTPPYFIGNLTAEVKENVPINTLVLTLHAEDGDRGIPRKIAYSLEESKFFYHNFIILGQ